MLELAPLTNDEEVMKFYLETRDFPTEFLSIDDQREPLRSGAFIARQEEPSGLF
jgi:hypothetical protein